MKKLILSIFFILSCWIVNAQDQATEWSVHQDATNNVSIQYPNDWTLAKEGFMGTAFVIASPLESEKDDFSENVNLAVEDLHGAEMTVEKYAEFAKIQIETLVNAASIIKAEKTNFQGQEAYLLEYQGTQGIYKLHWKQIYVIKNGKAYVLTYTANQDKYNTYLEVANKMFNSFKL